MPVATISAEVNISEVPFVETLLKKIRAKKVKVQMPKTIDDTSMTEAEFRAKINRALEGDFAALTREERKKLLFGDEYKKHL
ncbi:hypothetical protein SAMN05444369_10846 [Capnocytophaga haemolytica]|jgi:hypothetical protein|uniref:Uncharacterized protein n=1 Tax=Capnocytophaga haemolytica TaxID=45243 RepID=A0AAX2H0L1_9FLAO|nr:hypothetical protein [Capnocytophaga haemolytica]AMD84088.1 hypothetical protein AXF12_00145 [Capnocytophaga haemolytica]SFO06451.1 hypothetical protein SAMN05444369_10846 [Capnocytophaga haemolytica]SNV13580.1 Uncharacterised protein [Capnocytophaga haemolytica]